MPSVVGVLRCGIVVGDCCLRLLGLPAAPLVRARRCRWQRFRCLAVPRGARHGCRRESREAQVASFIALGEHCEICSFSSWSSLDTLLTSTRGFESLRTRFQRLLCFVSPSAGSPNLNDLHSWRRPAAGLQYAAAKGRSRIGRNSRRKSQPERKQNGTHRRPR